MLRSWWQYKPDGLRSPKRPEAWTNRHDARRSLSPRLQARGDPRLVALMLRVDAPDLPGGLMRIRITARDHLGRRRRLIVRPDDTAPVLADVCRRCLRAPMRRS